MRLPEQKLWDDLRDSMAPYWFARRIEDRLGAGLPDLMFIINRSKRRTSWMELKVLPSLPNERRMFDIPHFTADQRGFGLTVLEHGGAVAWWLMTRCGDVDHLHNATIIPELGSISYKVFRNKAAWVGRISPAQAATVKVKLL